MVLHVLLLRALGHGGRHGVVARHHARHEKGEFGHQLLPGVARHGAVLVAEIGVFAKQRLPQPVFHHKTDDGLRQRPQRTRRDAQAHGFAAHHPGQGLAGQIAQAHVRDACTALAEGSGLRIESEYLQVIAQVAGVEPGQALVAAQGQGGLAAGGFGGLLSGSGLGLHVWLRFARPASLRVLRIQLAQIGFAHLLGRALLAQAALVQPDGVVAQAFDGVGVVADEQHRARLHEAAQKTHALLREKGIAHGQRFVDHQHVGIHMRDHGEGQPHQHAA